MIKIIRNLFSNQLVTLAFKLDCRNQLFIKHYVRERTFLEPVPPIWIRNSGPVDHISTRYHDRITHNFIWNWVYNICIRRHDPICWGFMAFVNTEHFYKLLMKSLFFSLWEVPRLILLFNQRRSNLFVILNLFKHLRCKIKSLVDLTNQHLRGSVFD